MDPEHDEFLSSESPCFRRGGRPRCSSDQTQVESPLAFFNCLSWWRGAKIAQRFWGEPQSKGETRKDEHMAVGSELWLNTWDVDKVIVSDRECHVNDINYQIISGLLAQTQLQTMREWIGEFSPWLFASWLIARVIPFASNLHSFCLFKWIPPRHWHTSFWPKWPFDTFGACFSPFLPFWPQKIHVILIYNSFHSWLETWAKYRETVSKIFPGNGLQKWPDLRLWIPKSIYTQN